MNHPAALSRPTHPWVAAGQSSIRFGILLCQWPRERPALIELAQQVESLGFDSCWACDHPIFSGGDCWTTLAALATVTNAVRLGSLTSCVYYRSSALLARMAADVDRLSNGRLILGLGIGDAAEEFAQLGLPFRGVRERQQVLEETIQIVRGLWGEAPFTYEGTYSQVRNTTISP